MSKIFFIKSDTIDLKNFTLKDPLGSSGRLDVISRCVLAALVKNGSFEENTQIWTFLGEHGTFIFDTDNLDYETFPKNELKLTSHLVKIIQEDRSASDCLESVIKKNTNIFDAIKEFLRKEYDIYILEEDGRDFCDQISSFPSKSRIFIIGNQVGDFITSEELQQFNFPSLSFGTQSYLASSIIRLIHIHLK